MESAVRRIGFCHHCGNRAYQQIVYKHEGLNEGYLPDGTEYSGPCDYYVAICEICGQIILYRDSGGFVEDYNDGLDFITPLWPDSGKLSSAVPSEIREIYTEAIRIKKLAPNAFAVQIRRAIEALCDNRGATKGPLIKRLQDLTSQGEIPPTLSEMSGIIRLLGNIGAHYKDQIVKPLHAQVIDDFFHAIVEYVYIAPNRLKEFRENLETLEREGSASG